MQIAFDSPCTWSAIGAATGMAFLGTGVIIILMVRINPKRYANKAGMAFVKRLQIFTGEIGYCNNKGMKLLVIANFLLAFSFILMAATAYPLKTCKNPVCTKTHSKG